MSQTNGASKPEGHAHPKLSISETAVRQRFQNWRTAPKDTVDSIVGLVESKGAGSENDLHECLSQVAERIVTEAYGYTEEVDNLVSIAASISSRLDEKVRGEFAARLRQAIEGKLGDMTTRMVTPEENWGGDPTRKYWKEVTALSLLLGKLFAYDEGGHGRIFKSGTWPLVEDVLVKGVFSGDDAEPGAYVSCTVLVLSNGRSIRSFLKEEKKGQGKKWVWYNGDTDDKSEWGWEELVEGIEGTKDHFVTEATRDRDVKVVAVEVKEGLKTLREHVSGELGEDWSVGKVLSGPWNTSG